MKRVSWAALTAGLLLSYACANAIPLGDDVYYIQLDGGGVASGAGGTAAGAGGTAQGGTGAIGGGATGGTGTTGGTGGTAGSAGTGGTAGTAGTAGTGGQGGTGGTAGAGGTDGAGGTAPTVAGNCVEASDVAPIALTVFYSETSNAANTIGVTLAVSNTGSSFPRSDLTIRYWFTGGAPADFVGEVDFAAPAAGATALVKEDVDVTFGTELGSNYAEVNVDQADAIANGYQTIQIRIHNLAFSSLEPQTDDFSYVADVTNVSTNLNVTAFVAGEQVFGCTPPDP
jgi:cellulose binding protein with CBM3 domain